MRHAEPLAGGGLDEAAGEGLARRKRHGMHQDVEGLPVGLQMREPLGNLLIGCHVHDEGQLRPQLLGERHDAVRHALDMREGEFGALAVHGLRDAPGDGPVGGKANDQRAFAA